jgi:hypothetical protein
VAAIDPAAPDVPSHAVALPVGLDDEALSDWLATKATGTTALEAAEAADGPAPLVAVTVKV